MAVVTSIDLTAGGTAVHVTVQDQSDNPLPPAMITWSAISDVTITPDDTGFLFAASAAAPTEEQATFATYSGPGNPNPVVGGPLTCNITAAATVTALQYASP